MNRSQISLDAVKCCAGEVETALLIVAVGMCGVREGSIWFIMVVVEVEEEEGMIDGLRAAILQVREEYGGRVDPRPRAVGMAREVYGTPGEGKIAGMFTTLEHL